MTIFDVLACWQVRYQYGRLPVAMMPGSIQRLSWVVSLHLDNGPSLLRNTGEDWIWRQNWL